MSSLKPYTGVRCMCLLTGCQAGAGCPHYNANCKAHIAHQQAEQWVQCTTVSNECLGGCRSRAEHERFSKDWNRRAQPAITPETGNAPPQVASAITSETVQAGALLTEQEIVKCLTASGCVGTIKMSYDSGPYEITRTSINADRFARAIESAVRAKLFAGRQ